MLCGEIVNTQRKDWLKGAARKKDWLVYCQTYIRAEHVLENEWRIDYEKVLGAGTFGTVYEGYLVDAGRPCAVKCMSLTADMLEEVSLQGLCAHPNVLKVLGSCESVDKLFVALELCPQGDLFNLIEKRSINGFDLEEVNAFMTDLMSAVRHLHMCGVTHRDIKPANILCQEIRGYPRRCLKLADFGLAAFWSPTGKTSFQN